MGEVNIQHSTRGCRCAYEEERVHSHGVWQQRRRSGQKAKKQRHSARGSRRPPSVLAVVLTFNSIRWIEPCLSTLLGSDYPNVTVLVVDNASTDGTLELVRRLFPDVETLSNRRNLGCAAGNNKGLLWAVAHGMDYVFVLNPDTVLERRCISELVDAAENHRHYGVMSPFQYTYEGTELDPNFARILERCVCPGSAAGAVVDADKVIGAAMLLRTEMVREIGGFDPTYFLYGEETDFCHRAQYHGWKLGLVPSARANHWHRLVQERSSGRQGLHAYRARYIKIMKDGTLSEYWRGRQYLEALQHDMKLMRQGRAKVGWGTFLRAHAYVGAHLVTLLKNARRERRGSCHLWPCHRPASGGEGASAEPSGEIR